MLRREAGDWWVIISQLEHARLAFDLAQWHSSGQEEDPFGLWLEAVRHHDDGWREWEQAPDLNPEGEPRAFDEMRMEISTGIWERSIAICAERSAWGGLWVSRHFCFLAERVLAHLPEGVSASAAQGFLEQQKREQAAWREELAGWPRDEHHRVEEWGYRHLQLFDRLSLWVCLSVPGEERVLELPEGGELQLLRTGKNVIEMSAGFLCDETVPFQVAAKRVRKDAFHDAASWNEAWKRAEGISLEWVVRPTGESS
ncbi:MAG: DUF3891 family protein [Planctomycetales bacterium]